MEAVDIEVVGAEVEIEGGEVEGDVVVEGIGERVEMVVVAAVVVEEEEGGGGGGEVEALECGGRGGGNADVGEGVGGGEEAVAEAAEEMVQLLAEGPG